MKKKPILVIKIGTNILTTPSRWLDLNNLRSLIFQVCDELDRGQYDVVVVTSGAITCGAERMGFFPETIPEKQAAAAVGQILLMQEYTHFFGTRGYAVGQLLLTKDSLENPIVKENAHNTLMTLISRGIVPIVNENDSVATNEIGPKFGDNDELSAEVARLTQASRVILLSDIDGVYSDNPKLDPSAVLLPEIGDVESVLQVARDVDNGRSRGGMKSKLTAAKSVIESGADVWIANGRSQGVIAGIQNGERVGTRIKK